ncbi:hypothetical protein L1987_77979 [Smallanthus sonchifolius]|uniref:Uncharacterized protein n=1 Tax=Smallanthus sonchifolius TaxID=185202 RepID=A0ACB8ZBL2_9ASTR|nr:hypothetical protein L1987_77979 [Smallanthus sonchifolius]
MAGVGDRRPRDREWQEWGGRRRQVKRQVNHRRYTWGKEVTTFFVSNLPEGTKGVDLKTCFGEYGRVVDAYVAAKKDRAGYHFGFVRFERVRDTMEMEKQLSTVNLNNARLSVNLAKFNKEGKPNRAEGGGINNCPHPGHQGRLGKRSVRFGQRKFVQECIVKESVSGGIGVGTTRGSRRRIVKMVDDGDWVPEWNAQIRESPNSGNLGSKGAMGEEDISEYVNREVEETIKLGKVLGIEMGNVEEQVRVTIIGELEEAMYL